MPLNKWAFWLSYKKQATGRMNWLNFSCDKIRRKSKPDIPHENSATAWHNYRKFVNYEYKIHWHRKICLLRLGVRTRGFHPRNGGSIPPGDGANKKDPAGSFLLALEFCQRQNSSEQFAALLFWSFFKEKNSSKNVSGESKHAKFGTRDVERVFLMNVPRRAPK